LGLADAIAELRTQIEKARVEGAGKPVRFSAKQIEVELSIEFGLKAEVSAGISKWVPFVDLAAKAGGNENSSHKIKLTLEMEPIDGAGRLIADDEGPKPAAREANDRNS
jgi:hypothetical protein